MKFNVRRKILLMSKFFLQVAVVQGIFVSLAFSNNAHTQSLEDTQVNYNWNRIKLEQAFADVQYQTDFFFSYSPKLIEKVSISGGKYKMSLLNLLKFISGETGLQFIVQDDLILVQYDSDIKVQNNTTLPRVNIKIPDLESLEQELLFSNNKVIYQSVKSEENEVIKGIVQSEYGAPLIGATVLVKNTNIGTVTDIDGSFTITIPDEVNPILVISFIGYQNKEVEINGQSFIEIALSEDINTLGEVVVTALGIEREQKALGYATQEVAGGELVQANDGNVLNSLKGKVAGLQINTSNAGLTGSSSTVLRGFTSLGGNNDALYVIDGIPYSNFTPNQPNSGFAPPGQSDNILSVDRGSGIGDLDPNTIESITVLKGPSASALYGSRGANGVILITTKKGSRNKKLGVTYSGTVRASILGFTPDLQNEYGQGSRNTIGQFTNQEDVNNGAAAEAFQDQEASWGPRFDGQPYIVAWRRERFERPYQANPDLVNDFYQTGITFTNSLSFDGGDEKGSFSASLLAENLEDIVPNSTQDKYGLNVRLNRNLTERLSFDTRLSYTSKITNNRLIAGHRGAGFALNIAPRDIYTQDLEDFRYGFSGKTDWDDFRLDDHPTTWLDSRGSSAGNPYWEINENPNEDQQERITGFAKLDYKFSDKFSVFGRVGFDNYTQDFRYVREKYSRFGGLSYEGFLREGNDLRKEINADFLFTYQDQISQDLEFILNGGGNRLYIRNDSRRLNGNRLILVDQTHMGNAEDTNGSSNFNMETGVNSLYGLGSLVYKNAVYLDVTARNDWFSTLSDDNNSLFYSSYNLAVSLTDAFNLQSSFIDFAKIRASYAEAGNGTGQSIFTFANFNVDGLGRPSGGISNSLGNVDLKPERNISLEFGADLRFFGNRLGIDVTWYDARIEDQIVAFPLAQSSGATSRSLNVGEIRNQGIELILNAGIIRKQNLSWNSTLNFARNRSELVEISDDIDQFLHWGFRTQSGGGIISKEGESYAAIYGTTLLRDDQGRIVVDANGIPFIGEVEKIGETQPDFIAGFDYTFRFKNFSLGVLIDGSFGGEVVSQTFLDMNRNGTSVQSLDGRADYITSYENGTTIDGSITTGSTAGGLDYYVGNSVFEDGTLNEGANAVYANPAQYWNQV